MKVSRGRHVRAIKKKVPSIIDERVLLTDVFTHISIKQ